MTNAYQRYVVSRLRLEFLEMPGTRLSVAQASRLLSVDRATGRRALETLVDEGFLERRADLYVRREAYERCA